MHFPLRREEEEEQRGQSLHVSVSSEEEECTLSDNVAGCQDNDITVQTLSRTLSASVSLSLSHTHWHINKNLPTSREEQAERQAE